MPTSETLERFIALVEQNAHVEACEQFYTESSSMQENQSPPRTESPGARQVDEVNLCTPGVRQR